MSPGFITLHRKIKEHWIFDDPVAFKIWITMLLDAKFADTERMVNGVLVQIKRGQLAFGLEQWSREHNVTCSKLRTLLKNLEKCGMISRQKTNKFSLITIINYDQYQSIDRQMAGSEQASRRQKAGSEQGKQGEQGKIDTSPAGAGSVPDCPHQDIIDLYHKHCPTMPKVQIWNDKRKRALKARWRESEKHQSLEFWQKLFDYVNQSPFLRGDSKPEWSASLEWIINPTNFAKIIEGNYHKGA